jgi:hypothetical protein
MAEQLAALPLPYRDASSAYRRQAGPAPDAAAQEASPNQAPAPPPPPYRGAPTLAQRPAQPSLPPGAPAEAVARRLLQLTQGALARQELLQIASIPDAASGPAWMFELPFLTPQGTAVAQFQVGRDPRESEHPDEDGAAPAWRARFSIDAEPLGPVHASVVLAGGKAGVSLWAEREDSARLLRREQPALASALDAAGLEPELDIRQGAPRRAAAAPGRFLDRAT